MTTETYAICSPLFLKQAAQLKKAGGKAACALRMAERILVVLNRCGVAAPFLKCKQTKHGEHRADNVDKYDLGAGYRMVGILQEDRCVFHFIGSHDKCDLWLKNMRAGQGLAGVTWPDPGTEEDAGEPVLAGYEPSEPDPYEERLFARLDDRTLREVFSGLEQVGRKKGQGPGTET